MKYFVDIKSEACLNLVWEHINRNCLQCSQYIKQNEIVLPISEADWRFKHRAVNIVNYVVKTILIIILEVKLVITFL
jgi:hypothetical protein